MPNRQPFVSNGLHRISKHIADSTAKKYDTVTLPPRNKELDAAADGEYHPEDDYVDIQQEVEYTGPNEYVEDEVVYEESAVTEEVVKPLPMPKQAAVPKPARRKPVRLSNPPPQRVVEEPAEYIEPAPAPAPEQRLVQASEQRSVEVPVPSPAQAPEPIESPVAEEPAVVSEKSSGIGGGRSKEHTKALKKRVGEVDMLRSDLLNRLTKELATIPDEIDRCRAQIDLYEKNVALYNELFAKVEQLDVLSWNDNELTRELSTGVRMLENSRLEFLAALSRQKKTGGAQGQDVVVADNSSSLIELASMSFRQLFRMGFIISLPFMIVLIICFVLLGGAIVAAMWG